MDRIDFVIPWVDGSDRAWIEERRKYRDDDTTDSVRYRDWGILRYYFRGVEKFAPWVGKVFFITWGHIPEWMNTDNEKLCIISHRDYIPAKYLPTFSSHTIELNLFRIKTLSNRFVYFNDDFFLIRPVMERDFFVGDKPCDMAVLYPGYVAGTDSEFDHILLNDAELFSRHFDINKLKKDSPDLWFNPVYGHHLIKNICMFPFPYFTGFMLIHQPQSIKKSTMKEVWQKEWETLDATSSRKFRSTSDVNQYVFRYWQLGKKDFHPINLMKRGRFFSLNDRLNYTEILNSGFKTITLNDSDPCIDYSVVKRKLIKAFQTILPEKSSFEL